MGSGSGSSLKPPDQRRTVKQSLPPDFDPAAGLLSLMMRRHAKERMGTNNESNQAD
jgi:hypothetical protein